MLNEYYAVRGWDENRVPRNETLKRLGLLGEKDYRYFPQIYLLLMQAMMLDGLLET